MRVRVLVNPKAGSGSAARRLPAILAEFEQAGANAEAAETRGPGDAARLVDEARRDGVDCIAVVGGDGTFNEVTQAFLGPAGEPVEGPPLGIVPSGTGGDFRRTFGLGTTTEEAVARIMASPPRAVDLGVLELTQPDGVRVTRAFANIMSFGIGGLTDRIVSRGPKWLGGRAAFLLGTLRAMAVYRNCPVRVVVDGQVLFEGPAFNVAVANGRFFGGGMKIAPNADPTDGVFDVVVLGDLSRARSVSLSRHIYRGTHLTTEGVLCARGQDVRAEPLADSTEVLIDMDGETPGRLPLRARVAPAALRIRI
jgi:YegS/Rv2252/BmrU family lipid kinase